MSTGRKLSYEVPTTLKQGTLDVNYFADSSASVNYF